MPPGSLHCCKRLSRQNADSGRRGVHGRAAVLACSSPKTSTGKILPHRRPQSRLQMGHVARPGHMTHLEERAAHTHPETLLSSHFICVGVPAPTGPSLRCHAGWGGRDVHAGGAEGGPDHSACILGSQWKPPPRTLERRAGRGVPPWACGPRPLRSAGLTAPLGENRQHVRHDQRHPVRVRLSSGSEAPCAPNSGGAVCPVQVLRAEGRFVPGSARPPPLGPLHSPEPGSRESRL